MNTDNRHSATAETDGHLFQTVSTHNTSQGPVAYKKCACGRWLIESYPVAHPVHVAASEGPSAAPVDRLRDRARSGAVPVYH